MEKQNQPRDENNFDSPANTRNAGRTDGESLTNDEKASTDPNLSSDKASFDENSAEENSENTGRFDGTIGI